MLGDHFGGLDWCVRWAGGPYDFLSLSIKFSRVESKNNRLLRVPRGLPPVPARRTAARTRTAGTTIGALLGWYWC
jgi:hypothetical protein